MNENAATEYLQSLLPGRLPHAVFMEFARLMVISTIELVPLRMVGGKVEVLLLQRPEGDTWAGMWHVPGTIIFASDKMDHGHDYEQPLSRLLAEDGELGGIEIVGKPVEVETERRRTLRGDEVAVIHCVEIAGEPRRGRFFRLDGFPDTIPDNGIIPHHVDFVRRTATYFTQLKDAAKSGISANVA